VRLDASTRAEALFVPVAARVAALRPALPGLLPHENAVVGARLARLLEIAGSEAPNDVTWVSFNRDGRATMKRAPIEVAAILRETLFDGKETIIATSATLALNGSFEYFRRRTGMPQAGLFEMVLESPFDFLNQALLCIPDEVAAPGDQGYEENLVDVIERVALELGGRTLVLFTSNDQLNRVSNELRLRLEPRGIDILAQVRGSSRRMLVEQFAARSTTVLCGTSSFWEGVDLPGDMLSCVVIARLPFRPPSDPVMRARGERLRDSFLELALPEAVLRLKQGFGRLIRRSSDRGAVVIFDTRVSTRNYGKHFLDSLPECASFTGPAGEVPAAVAAWVEGRREANTLLR
jgi:ATP-dependent DNA helicase DinG